MRMRIRLLLPFFPLIAGAQESPTKDDLAEQFLDAIPRDTITSAEVAQMNGFRVESSRVKELGLIFGLAAGQ